MLQSKTLSAAAQVEPRRKAKSRDGCQRCKLKRLKCDETKPDCANCVRRGILCPGYKKFIKWSTKYEAYMPDASRTLVMGPNQVTEDQRTCGVTASASPVERSIRPEGSATETDASPDKRKDQNVKSRKRARDESDEDAEREGEVLAEKDRRRAAVEEHFARVKQCVDPVPEPTEDSEEAGTRDPESVVDFTEPSVDMSVMDELALNTPAFEEPPLDTPAMDDPPLDLPSLDLPDLPNLDWATLTGSSEDSPPDGTNKTTYDEEPPEEIPRMNSPLSRALLRSYARLSAPMPAPSLVEPGIALVEHYFKNVCMLYSSFDSSLNPFRSAVGRIWDSSPSIYYAIQSMAAAQLANTYPRMIPTGLEMQRKAYECLNEEIELVATGSASSERALLALLLLGLTACWHDGGDLGLKHLFMARKLIYPRLIAPVPPQNKIIRRQNQFFEESLIYWEMLIGFVSQDSSAGPLSVQNLELLGSSLPSSSRNMAMNKLLPHPWTGIAPQVMRIFAEVGRLIREERLSHAPGTQYTADTQAAAQERTMLAAQLEESLLSTDLPMADDLIDPGDANTTRADFVALGEAYRCAGLLELYRVFPAILKKRLGANSTSAGWEKTGICGLTPSTAPGTAREATDMRLWLNSLALHTLALLEALPDSSGTSATQPILLVAAAGELRFVSSLDYFDLHACAERVRHARRFVVDRLREFMRRLPKRPLARMLRIVEEVWRRLDKGEDVFWVDVMWVNGWQTVMG